MNKLVKSGIKMICNEKIEDAKYALDTIPKAEYLTSKEKENWIKISKRQIKRYSAVLKEISIKGE